jgi:hypothetical protein
MGLLAERSRGWPVQVTVGHSRRRVLVGGTRVDPPETRRISWAAAVSRLSHVEIWVAGFEAARVRWVWLFGMLGWVAYQEWPGGCSWRGGDGAYVVLEESPDLLRDVPYDRRRAGLNHLAVIAIRSTVDRLAEHG